MRTTRSLVFISLLVLLAVPAVQAQTTFGAVLNIAQEVPAPTGPNLNGFGNATVTLDAAHTSVTVNMTVAGLTTPVNNAHIHKGPIRCRRGGRHQLPAGDELVGRPPQRHVRHRQGAR